MGKKHVDAVTPNLSCIAVVVNATVTQDISAESGFLCDNCIARYDKFYSEYYVQWGRGSSVGIATRYGLDGPGIET